MKRIAVFVVLVAVLGAVAPFAIPGAVVTQASAAPPGFASVPDDKITEQGIPDSENEWLGLTESELLDRAQAGGTMASEHGSTLAAHWGVYNTKSDTWVNDNAVNAVLNNNSPDEKFPLELRFQLTDDTNSDGREVAIRESVIEGMYGYEPGMARGVHENGSEWEAEIEYEDGFAVFEVPHFSTNTITFSGTFRYQSSSATDGATFNYDIGDAQSLGNFSIDLVGSVATEWDNASAGSLANGDTFDMNIAGNLDPTGPASGDDPQLVLTGTQSTGSTYNPTGTGDGSITVNGDADPTGPNNGEPEIEFTGTESTGTQTTDSGSDGGSIDPAGHLDPLGPSTNSEPEITFKGKESTTTDNYANTGIDPSATESISADGNLDPTDGSGGEPTLEVTGHGSSGTYNAENTWGDGQTSNLILLGDRRSDFGGGASDSEMDLKPDKTGDINSITVNIAQVIGSDYGANVDVYMDTGGFDQSFGGTLVKDSWDPDWSTGGQTITFDTPYSVTSGNVYHLSFDTLNADGDNNDDRLEIETENTGSNRFTTYNGDSWATRTDAADVDYSIDGQVSGLDATIGDNTVNFGDFSDGQTKTKNIDVNVGDSSLDFSASAGASIDYSLTMEERTGTEDPAVDIDGDGTNEATASGILASGQTSTVELADLTNGAQTVDTKATTAGPAPDWDITYSPKYATEDPSVDVTGDGSPDASASGIYTSGQTVTKQLSALPSGSVSVDTSTTGGSSPQPDWNITYDEELYSTDPAADVDGDGVDEASVTGKLSPGQTDMTDLSSLTLSDNTVTMSTTSGTTVDAEVKLKERTETVDPAVEVNGQTVSHDGSLSDGISSSLDTNTTWLTDDSTNKINISVGDGSLTADAPSPQVDVDYIHDIDDDVNINFTDEQFQEVYNFSRTYSSDRSQSNVTVPTDSSVLSVRSLDTRVNTSGGWSSVADANYQLDGNNNLDIDLDDVYGGDIPATTDIEVRMNASKVQVNNGSITVDDPTLESNDVSTSLTLDTWDASTSYIDVSGTAQGDEIHYTSGESWSEPDSYTVVEAGGVQRLHMPNAAGGASTTIETLPVTVDPATGQVNLSVDSVNETMPRFAVSPGANDGDIIDFTFTEATDEQYYELYSVTHDTVRDSGTASSPLTLQDDDSDEVLQFQEAVESSGGNQGGAPGGVAPTAAESTRTIVDTLLPVGLLVIGFGAFVIFVRRFIDDPSDDRSAGSGDSGIVGTITGSLSKVAVSLADAITLVAGYAQRAATSSVALAALGGVFIFAVFYFDAIQLGVEGRTIIAAAAVLLGLYVGLERFGEFDWRLYGVMVAVLTMIALGAVGTDILGQIISSQVFPIIVVAGIYFAWQGVQAYRQGRETSIEVVGRLRGD